MEVSHDRCMLKLLRNYQIVFQTRQIACVLPGTCWHENLSPMAFLIVGDKAVSTGLNVDAWRDQGKVFLVFDFCGGKDFLVLVFCFYTSHFCIMLIWSIVFKEASYQLIWSEIMTGFSRVLVPHIMSFILILRKKLDRWHINNFPWTIRELRSQDNAWGRNCHISQEEH